MTDIEQSKKKKIVPLITCEIPFSEHVCEWVFGVNVTDLNFGSKLILSRCQSGGALWFRDTCPIVELRPLIIILTTA